MKIQDYCDTVDGALRLKTPLSTFCRGNIVTDDDDMKRQLDLLVRCGQGRVPLTICGEKGSGKDRIAQYAHEVSVRNGVPLIKMNCAYLTAEQQFVNLFGPAANKALGLLSRAAGGSLYIENVDLMPVHLQYQLVDFIRANIAEEKSIRFMVCFKEQAALHSGLSEEMASYFNTMVFDIPPLRKRPQDVLLLTFQQLQTIRQEYRLERKLSPEVMSAMLTYDWPGNARQLAHAIERMAILSDDMLIDSVHLLHRCIAPEQQQRRQSTATTIAPESRSLKRIVQDYEFMIIQQSIEQHGSIRKAAAALKTSHATLSRKITEYHLLPPESERTLK